MRSHVIADELLRWKRGELRADEVIAVAQHLEACTDCAALSARTLRVEASAGALRVQVEDDPHPDLERELFAYVDGTLAAGRHAAVAAHLAECGVCTQDVEDARRVRESSATASATRPGRPDRRARWLAAAAMLLMAIAALLVVLLRGSKPPDMPAVVTKTAAPAPPHAAPPPAPRPVPRYARGEWEKLVRDVWNGSSIAAPAALAAIHREADVLRAPGSDAAEAALAPAGVVIETQRPAFTWPATPEASYVVSIFAADREVARSKRLSTPAWTPPRDLQRGTTYSWQVEVETAADLRIVPEPPAPPARFHIADAGTIAELEAAGKAHPGDHLLLGLLAARAGLADRAGDELRRVESAEERAIAARVLRDVESWTARNHRNP